MRKITTKDIVNYIDELLMSGEKVVQLDKKVAAFLIAQNNTRDIHLIRRLLESRLEKRGHALLHITTTKKVGIATKRKVAELFGVKSPLFSETIDERLIGGMRVECGERLLDVTVAAKLEKFKYSVDAR